MTEWILRIRDELRARGFKFRGDEQKHNETPESVMKKFNVTPEQWAVIPDAKQPPSR
jgi:hypothetical protein